MQAACVYETQLAVDRSRATWADAPLTQCARRRALSRLDQAVRRRSGAKEQ
jgi:hypothetical protein